MPPIIPRAALALTKQQHSQSAVTLHRVAAFCLPRSPLFELACLLVRFDRVARFIVNANHSASSLSATQTHAANQSTPLMPAQPEDAEQPTRDRSRLRNYRALYPDIVDNVLDIATI